MGTRIEDISKSADETVARVINQIKEMLGVSFDFKGVEIKVSRKDGRAMSFVMNDERVKDLLNTLVSRIICTTFDLLRDDIRSIKVEESKPEWGPSPTPQLALNAHMLNVLEKKIMTKVEDKITAAVAQIQMSTGQEVDPKDYNKHLFGKRNA